MNIQSTHVSKKLKLYFILKYWQKNLILKIFDIIKVERWEFLRKDFPLFEYAILNSIDILCLFFVQSYSL